MRKLASMEPFIAITGVVFAALIFTSFVKILTALNILRYGIGLSDAPFGLVMVGAAGALSMLVMAPAFDSAGGLDGITRGGLPVIERTYRPFLERHADKKTVDRLTLVDQKLKKAGAKDGPGEGIESQKPVSFPVLVVAFLISELTNAFTLGLLFLIPFVVIDLAVANLLMALGATQISQHVVTLPLKLLLFIAVDGWTLVSEKLLASYI